MITLAEAKLQLNIAASDTTHDVELQAYVGAATLAVERHTGLVGEVRTVADERHQASSTSKLWLNLKPVQSVTAVERVDGSIAWDVSNLDVDPDSGLLRVTSGPLFDGLLSITYEAGYIVAPDNMNLAARIIVQHLWQTQRGAVATPGARAVMADSMQNLSNFGRGYAIPNAALELLGEPVPVVA